MLSVYLLGNTAEGFEMPGLDDTTLQFRNLSFQFESEPQVTDKTLPSGNRFLLYTTRKFTESGSITIYFQISDSGTLQDAEALLTKERQFAEALNRKEESAETLALGGYPAVRLITKTQSGGPEQRTFVQALLVDGYLVKIRVVGNRDDLTDEMIEDFSSRLTFG